MEARGGRLGSRVTEWEGIKKYTFSYRIGVGM